MTHSNNSASSPTISLSKRMITGAAIGLLVITWFLISVDEPNPQWGNLWMIRPLIIVPFAGAMAGLCNYFIMSYHNQFAVNKILAMIISAIISLFGLWIGIVLGLNGTLWN